jgi:hypothetical protein
MKVLSIIGIVWFSFTLLISIIARMNSNEIGAAEWGILGLLYALPYSIVGLVHVRKGKSTIRSDYDELAKLHELMEKGVITEDEFGNKKSELL